MTTSPLFWKVGDLAEKTGISVRALHHYEEIGLLVPSYRTESGHRLYTEDDVKKLQQIVSLKQMGFSLDDIKMGLGNPQFSLAAVLGMHTQTLSSNIKEQNELLERLHGIMRLLESNKSLTTDDVLRAIALTNDIENSLTEEQREGLKARRNALGSEGMKKAENDWKELMDAVKGHMEQGTDPTSPAMQELAKKWMGLVRAFSGGDPAIEAKVKKMYEENPDAGRMFGPDPKMMEYVGKAIDTINRRTQ